MASPAARIPYQSCPLCEATAAVEVLVADCSGHPMYKPQLPPTQRWIQCKSCGHVFVDGYFGPDAVAVLFSGTLEEQTPGHDIENQRYVWARVLETVNAQRSEMGGRWLDVGFGNGSLLSTAAEFGFEVVGLDLRRDNVRLMRELGFEVHAVELEEFRPDRGFDVISMADVLEHMPFPRRALRQAWNLLHTDGHVFLSMPSADSFLWQKLTRDGDNPYWGEIEHYHNFGRARLCALLEECGFRPVHYGVSLRYRACMEVIARKTERPAGT